MQKLGQRNQKPALQVEEKQLLATELLAASQPKKQRQKLFTAKGIAVSGTRAFGAETVLSTVCTAIGNLESEICYDY